MTYFAFAVADSMFPPAATARRRPLDIEEVRRIVGEGVVPALNPSHQATIDAMRDRYGIDVEVPETPPRVSLSTGDRIVVMSVRGLPRLTDRREYTEEEVASATFSFGVWEVIE